MSRNGRQAMAVRPQDLETPERGLTLEDRRGEGPRAAAPRDVELELQALRGRLDSARDLRAPEDAACRACWEAGAQAVVGLVAGEPRSPDTAAELLALQGRLEASRRLDPGSLHWRDCWIEGRDAAIGALEG